jgi:hypothetical protein
MNGTNNKNKMINCGARIGIVPAAIFSAVLFLLLGLSAAPSSATERVYVAPAQTQPRAPQKYVQPRPATQPQYQYKYRYQYSAPKNWYGNRRSVPNAVEAGKIMGQYYYGRGVTVGPVVEKDLFYQADVRDRRGVIVDKVIIDKRTGRMRSIY